MTYESVPDVGDKDLVARVEVDDLKELALECVLDWAVGVVEHRSADLLRIVVDQPLHEQLLVGQLRLGAHSTSAPICCMRDDVNASRKKCATLSWNLQQRMRMVMGTRRRCKCVIETVIRVVIGVKLGKEV